LPFYIPKHKCLCSVDVTEDLRARDARLFSTPLNFLQIWECWCLLGMRPWRWRIGVDHQHGPRPSKKTWKMRIFIFFSHPVLSRSDGGCGVYHLLSGVVCGRWPVLSKAQGSVPGGSSVRFIGINITSASRHALVVFFGLMLGKCQSCIASGLLLV